MATGTVTPITRNTRPQSPDSSSSATRDIGPSVQLDAVTRVADEAFGVKRRHFQIARATKFLNGQTDVTVAAKDEVNRYLRLVLLPRVWK